MTNVIFESHLHNIHLELNPIFRPVALTRDSHEPIFWVSTGAASRGYIAKESLALMNSLTEHRAVTLRHIKMPPTNLQL